MKSLGHGHMERPCEDVEKPGREGWEEINPANNLISGFYFLTELWEINACGSSHLVCAIWLW